MRRYRITVYTDKDEHVVNAEVLRLVEAIGFDGCPLAAVLEEGNCVINMWEHGGDPDGAP